MSLYKLYTNFIISYLRSNAERKTKCFHPTNENKELLGLVESSISANSAIMVDQCCLITDLDQLHFQGMCLCIHEHAKEEQDLFGLKIRATNNTVF